MTPLPVAPDVNVLHQSGLPFLRLAFSRSVGDASFEVARTELEVSGFTLTDCRAEMAWLLDCVKNMEEEKK